MMKKEVDEHLLYPLPVVLVGANVNNRPNYLVIGYISPFDFGKYIFFSFYRKQYTSLGVQQNQTFSVNIPSVKLFDKTIIGGTKSDKDLDKSSLFENFYGELKTAPMIRECPINMECKVTNVLEHGVNKGIIGKIIKTYVNPECLVNGKIDIQKVDPIV
jgi:flavin reductase (DIM6/NTAB) family NADH-FMN oxidoreductase RutF